MKLCKASYLLIIRRELEEKLHTLELELEFVDRVICVTTKMSSMTRSSIPFSGTRLFPSKSYQEERKNRYDQEKLDCKLGHPSPLIGINEISSVKAPMIQYPLYA